MRDEDLAWLPAGGVRLSRDRLATIFEALRALVQGTEPDEPNRAYAVTVAYVISEAIDDAGGDR